jgi:hypothetical protein
MEDFRRDYVRLHLDVLTPDEILRRFPADEILRRFSADEILQQPSVEEIRAYLEKVEKGQRV